MSFFHKNNHQVFILQIPVECLIFFSYTLDTEDIGVNKKS